MTAERSPLRKMGNTRNELMPPAVKGEMTR